MKPMTCLIISRARIFVVGVMIGCSPPGAVNEKAVLDSTPHSEPAAYAASREDYEKHMLERFGRGKSKGLYEEKKLQKGSSARKR